jgi:hypothetical protein
VGYTRIGMIVVIGAMAAFPQKQKRSTVRIDSIAHAAALQALAALQDTLPPREVVPLPDSVTVHRDTAGGVATSASTTTRLPLRHRLIPRRNAVTRLPPRRRKSRSCVRSRRFAPKFRPVLLTGYCAHARAPISFAAVSLCPPANR